MSWWLWAALGASYGLQTSSDCWKWFRTAGPQKIPVRYSEVPLFRTHSILTLTLNLSHTQLSGWRPEPSGTQIDTRPSQYHRQTQVLVSLPSDVCWNEVSESHQKCDAYWCNNAISRNTLGANHNSIITLTLTVLLRAASGRRLVSTERNRSAKVKVTHWCDTVILSILTFNHWCVSRQALWRKHNDN